MDENQNSLTDYKVEDLSTMQQLSRSIGRIIIDQNNCQDEPKETKDYTTEKFNFENATGTLFCKVNTDLKMSLDSTDDIENQVAAMSFIDIPLTSTSLMNSTIEPRKSIYCQAMQQNTDLQAITIMNSGCVNNHKDKRQNGIYHSYSNLINMYCCKCKIISKNLMDCRCSECQSLWQFQCKKCSSLYKTFIAVLSHIKYDCYKLPTFYCTTCVYSTHLKTSIDKHIELKHASFSESEYRHECFVCKKKFKKQYHMLKHSKVCNKNKPYLMCRYCPYKTKLNEVLKLHMQKKHQLYMARNYKCSDCNKERFRDAKSLYLHRKFTCRVKKFYKCDHCNFETVQRFALVKHFHEVHRSFYERI